MNRNDQDYIVSKIRTAYTPKQQDGLDELRRLDAKVRRPTQVFSYILGSLGALIMGAGMCVIMTEFGDALGAYATLVGIAVGALGLTVAVCAYPIYRAVSEHRKNKIASEILSLVEKLSQEE